MGFIAKLKNIDNTWFFTELPAPLKMLLLFVKGDLLVLVPLSIAIFLTGFISLRFMLAMIGVYIAVRYFGEMIYWFSHRFTAERRYRPSDFGFKKLDNHAIYIIYQTYSVAGVVFGAGMTIYSLFFMK